MPWLHSVTQERDFKDPWTAQDFAFHLAVQVAQELHDGFPILTIGPSPNVFHKSGIKRAAGTRRFCVHRIRLHW